MNIYVNCANGDGIMMFTEVEGMTPELAQKFVESCGNEVIEAYNVRDDEVQYYCYDPVWITEFGYQQILKRLAS